MKVNVRLFKKFQKVRIFTGNGHRLDYFGQFFLIVIVIFSLFILYLLTLKLLALFKDNNGILLSTNYFLNICDKSK